MRKLLLGFASFAAFVIPAQLASQGQAAPAGKAQWGTFGVDFASMDRSVHPGDDFWSYVNGTWERTAEIPPDRGALSQVQRLNDLSSSQVRTILDALISRRASLSGDDLRIADYYASLMDQAAIDRRGAAPLLADLAPIRAAATHSALAAQMGRLVREWQGTPPVARMPRYFPSSFGVGIGQDRKDPDRYVPGIRQSGLGLPNRDYYLKSDEASQKTQKAYRAHIAAMLALAAVPHAEAASASIAAMCARYAFCVFCEASSDFR
jgi:putative endopeptidase